MQIPKGWQIQGKPVARSRQSKYKNKTIECDGLKFDSVKEARRYRELKILERAGEIREHRRNTRLYSQSQSDLAMSHVRSQHFVM